MVRRISAGFFSVLVALVLADMLSARSDARDEMYSELESFEPGTGIEIDENMIRSLFTARTDFRRKDIISVRWQTSSVSDRRTLEVLALIACSDQETDRKSDEIWLIRNDIVGWDLTKRLVSDQGIVSYKTVDVNNDGRMEIFYETRSGSPFCSRSSGKLVSLDHTVLFSNAGYECRSQTEDGMMGLERMIHDTFFFDIDGDRKLEILDRTEILNDNVTDISYEVLFYSQEGFQRGKFRRTGKSR